MNIESDTDFKAAVSRRLTARGRAPLAGVRSSGREDEVDAIDRYVVENELRAPFGSEDVNEVAGFVERLRGSEEPPAAPRGRRSFERMRSHAIRALRECELLVGQDPIKRLVERWRVENFGSVEAPFAAPDSDYGREGQPWPYLAVADWIFAQHEREPQSDEGRHGTDLAFPGRAAPTEVRVYAWVGESPLGDLVNVVHAMNWRIHCGDREAVAHVFTGKVPYTPPVDIKLESRAPFEPDAIGPMTIRVNYEWVPVEVVRWAYQEVREMALKERASLTRRRGNSSQSRPRGRPTAPVIELLKFVEQRPTMSWADRYAEWQKLYPGRHSSARSMRSVYTRATKRVGSGSERNR